MLFIAFQRWCKLSLVLIFVYLFPRKKMWELCSELHSTNNSSTLGLIFLSLMKFGKGRRKAACFLGERSLTEMISRMFKGSGGTLLVCKTLLHMNGWQCEWERERNLLLDPAFWLLRGNLSTKPFESDPLRFSGQLYDVLHSTSSPLLFFFSCGSLTPPPPCQPGVADQAVQTTGRHQKLNTHYFNLMLIMC